MAEQKKQLLFPIPPSHNNSLPNATTLFFTLRHQLFPLEFDAVTINSANSSSLPAFFLKAYPHCTKETFKDYPSLCFCLTLSEFHAAKEKLAKTHEHDPLNSWLVPPTSLLTQLEAIPDTLFTSKDHTPPLPTWIHTLKRMTDALTYPEKETFAHILNHAHRTLPEQHYDSNDLLFLSMMVMLRGQIAKVGMLEKYEKYINDLSSQNLNTWKTFLIALRPLLIPSASIEDTVLHIQTWQKSFHSSPAQYLLDASKTQIAAALLLHDFSSWQWKDKTQLSPLTMLFQNFFFRMVNTALVHNSAETQLAELHQYYVATLSMLKTVIPSEFTEKCFHGLERIITFFPIQASSVTQQLQSYVKEWKKFTTVTNTIVGTYVHPTEKDVAWSLLRKGKPITLGYYERFKDRLIRFPCESAIKINDLLWDPTRTPEELIALFTPEMMATLHSRPIRFIPINEIYVPETDDVAPNTTLATYTWVELLFDRLHKEKAPSTTNSEMLKNGAKYTLDTAANLANTAFQFFSSSPQKSTPAALTWDDERFFAKLMIAGMALGFGPDEKSALQHIRDSKKYSAFKDHTAYHAFIAHVETFYEPSKVEQHLNHWSDNPDYKEYQAQLNRFYQQCCLFSAMKPPAQVINNALNQGSLHFYQWLQGSNNLTSSEPDQVAAVLTRYNRTLLRHYVHDIGAIGAPFRNIISYCSALAHHEEKKENNPTFVDSMATMMILLDTAPELKQSLAYQSLSRAIESVAQKKDGNAIVCRSIMISMENGNIEAAITYIKNAHPSKNTMTALNQHFSERQKFHLPTYMAENGNYKGIGALLGQ